MIIKIVDFEKNGVRIYEPPETAEFLGWDGVSKQFKEDFLTKWKIAHHNEKVQSNAGIDTLGLLSHLQILINKGELNKTISFQNAFQQMIDDVFEKEFQDFMNNE